MALIAKTTFVIRDTEVLLFRVAQLALHLDRAWHAPGKRTVHLFFPPERSYRHLPLIRCCARLAWHLPLFQASTRPKA